MEFCPWLGSHDMVKTASIKPIGLVVEAFHGSHLPDFRGFVNGPWENSCEVPVRPDGAFNRMRSCSAARLACRQRSG